VRVGIIGPLYPDSFADNIADCLPDLGVNVVYLGTVRGRFPRRVDQAVETISRARPALDARLQRRLAERAIDERCEVVICVDAALLPETVRRMRINGIRTAMWFPDAVSQMDRQLMLIADYDRVYFKDPLLVERLRALVQVPVAYLPEACNPHWHVPIGEPGVVSEIVVAGNMYPNRVRLLDRLHNDGIPLRLYGAPFARWIPPRPVMERHAGREVVRREKAAVFRSASAVLNNLHPSELAGVNCRLFEAAGCGAAVLCEDRPALRECFDVGTEVLAFTTYSELKAQCLSLLSDRQLVRDIGNAAARRARQDHTYQVRLTSLLEDCAT
jgi:spore maturation protein CgeB